MAINDIDIPAAARRVAPFVHRTPTLVCGGIDRAVGRAVYFKCENLQKTGAFKARGAANALRSLPAALAAKGVITHSSGNHAAALGYAAAALEVSCHAVIPADAPAVKRDAAARYGAVIHGCAPGMAAREEMARQLIARHGYTLIHPYDDAAVVSGQGTATAELLAQAPPLDAIVLPIGGGGLISGAAMAIGQATTAAAAATQTTPALIGAEPAAVSEAAQSLKQGRRLPATGGETIADGLRAGVGELNYEIIRRYVERIIVVGEDQITQAMAMVWRRMKLVIEPSVALAALFADELPADYRRVGVILTGGNVDLGRVFGGDG